ncbi:hypothetical protein AHAT_09890 [Agarivorans sp. Toyoura001]|uniref:hypothetical protein n=1 Tax=Agarivorans sp. Toyoura001 TaxID=2283141 RepID=UPI0010DA8D2A|nr:hypothetical protein [Agarivorans sp. Toyoura001]GDY25099.1 hypothetical protein AHAT_09890 [Agarivorans sp. Toyoura001]
MSDSFFDKYENSLLNFVVGITVIMFIMFGAGVLCPLLILLAQQFVGEFTPKEFGTFFLVCILVMTLCIVVPNILIVRGKPIAAKINLWNIYFQLACYSLLLLLFKHEYKWLFLSFVSFPLLAYWLMLTTKYKAFVSFYEALRKDPVGFREKLLER